MGDEPLVACPMRSAIADALESQGLRTLALPAGGDLDPRAAIVIRAAVGAWSPHVVHTHCAHAHASALVAGVHRRSPLIVHRRVDFSIGHGIFTYVKYRAFPVHYICVSKAVSEVMRAGGIPDSRLTTIYSGIHPPRILDRRARLALAERLGMPLSRRWIGCVGSLVEHKGHIDLIQAFGEIARARDDIRLALIGSGPMDKKLRAQVDALGLTDRVRFLGHIGHPTDAMQLLDVYVVPSRQEGLNTSLLDACALGLPIVASQAGGIPEVVDERCGWPVPPRSPAALAQAILDALASTEEARERGRAARARIASRFTVERMTQETRKLYDKQLIHFGGRS